MEQSKVSPKAIDLMEKMLTYDPAKVTQYIHELTAQRINSLGCLQHEYFQVSIPVEIKAQQNFNQESIRHPTNAQNEASKPKKAEPKITKQEPRGAMYYLQKARYKPGVNISEMLSKQL